MAGTAIGFFGIAVMVALALVLPGWQAPRASAPAALDDAVPSEASYDAALSDALSLLQRERPPGEPLVMSSEEWTVD